MSEQVFEDGQPSPMSQHDWEVLLERYTDGITNPDSRYAKAAQAFKRHLADVVWDAVHANDAKAAAGVTA